MPTKKFTELAVQNLKPKKKQIEYFIKNFNPGVAGSLGLRVSPGGTKSWFIIYRLKNGSKHRFKLGSHPTLSLAEARKEAAAKLSDIDKGQSGSRETRRTRLSHL